ncbi:MAG TPA: SRPBCC family protein [Nitrospira sp.]|nr:SRPBCC family protein [Nitrospira sp.]
MRSSDNRRFGPRCSLALLLFLVLVEVLPAGAADREILTVTTESGGGVKAIAHVHFPASPQVVFAILTDYAHWPELFDVRMRVADLQVRDDGAWVDLRIDHALLPGERRLVTQSRAVPGSELVTDLVGGDFKHYHRVWTLAPGGAGNHTEADFELVVAIDSIVPDWLVALATRRELEAHFRIVKKKALEDAKGGR